MQRFFKVLHLSLRLEIHPEIENTSHQICRLNTSRPFDASRGSDKNFVFSFTGALLWGESAQELAADRYVCTCTERGAVLCKEDCLEHMFKVHMLPAQDIFGSLRRRRRALHDAAVLIGGGAKPQLASKPLHSKFRSTGALPWSLGKYHKTRPLIDCSIPSVRAVSTCWPHATITRKPPCHTPLACTASSSHPTTWLASNSCPCSCMDGYGRIWAKAAFPSERLAKWTHGLILDPQ